MKLSSVFYFLGILTLYFAAILIAPMGVSLLDGGQSLPAFFSTFCFVLVSGSFLVILNLNAPRNISIRSGFMIVTLTWLAYAFMGGLPYIFDGVLTNLTDAFFESMSGFTTTGATVFTAIEGQSKAILFWRSLTQYLGGMGIIVLGVAILPRIGGGGMQLFKAEVPGPSKDRIFPKIKDTATTLWGVYAVLTLAEITLLKFGGLSLFESICHSFTTMATGGFSTRNASIMAMNSAYLEWVFIFFMFMAGVNFTLHFHALRGRINRYFQSSEFIIYLSLFIVSTIVISLSIFPGSSLSFLTSIRQAAFQAISILTTTGYASVNFELWPALPMVILFLFMFIGAMAGSTGGGIKVIRLQILFKQSLKQIQNLLHPNQVYAIKIDKKPVHQALINTILAFLFLYLLIFVISVLILSAYNIDFVTSFSAVASCLGNIGPGFGTVGAMDNYAHLPILVKNLLSILMLLGRLELYTVLVIFSRAFWRD